MKIIMVCTLLAGSQYLSIVVLNLLATAANEIMFARYFLLNFHGSGLIITLLSPISIRPKSFDCITGMDVSNEVYIS